MPGSPSDLCKSHEPRISTLEERVEGLTRYFERVFKEHSEAVKVADLEREKSAANVRRALEETMKAGDARLEDHITHQIEQVKQALASLNAILKERDDRSTDQRKAEEQRFLEFKERTSSNFENVNELRGALDDQGKLMATRRDLEGLAGKVLPMIERNREDLGILRTDIIGKDTYNAAVKEWSKWRDDIDRWKDRTAGKGEGVTGTTRIAMGVAIFIATMLGIISFFISVTNKASIDRNTNRISGQSSNGESVKPK